MVLHCAGPHSGTQPQSEINNMRPQGTISRIFNYRDGYKSIPEMTAWARDCRGKVNDVQRQVKTEKLPSNRDAGIFNTDSAGVQNSE